MVLFDSGFGPFDDPLSRWPDALLETDQAGHRKY
jgi:hypothetical protein